MRSARDARLPDRLTDITSCAAAADTLPLACEHRVTVSHSHTLSHATIDCSEWASILGGRDESGCERVRRECNCDTHSQTTKEAAKRHTHTDREKEKQRL